MNRTKFYKDYSQITEIPGTKVTLEQVSRVYQRYFFAAQLCQGKDVLEVACGGGVGLGILEERARSVVGIDVEEKNLKFAQGIYGNDQKVRIHQGDAHRLAFPDDSFDVVLLYEAIYYLAEPKLFLKECRRILRPGGILLIGSANKEWKDFNPSVYSTRYFSCLELKQLLGEYGFEVDLFKGFSVSEDNGLKGKVISLIKRAAVKTHLIPKSMKYKKFLKRLFVGKLISLPDRLKEGMIPYIPPERITPESQDRQFKVIYAVGKLDKD